MATQFRLAAAARAAIAARLIGEWMNISGTPFSFELSIAGMVRSGMLSMHPYRDTRSAWQGLHSLLHCVQDFQFKTATCAKKGG
jgi:hypothetical protein